MASFMNDSAMTTDNIRSLEKGVSDLRGTFVLKSDQERLARGIDELGSIVQR